MGSMVGTGDGVGDTGEGCCDAPGAGVAWPVTGPEHPAAITRAMTMIITASRRETFGPVRIEIQNNILLHLSKGFGFASVLPEGIVRSTRPVSAPKM